MEDPVVVHDDGARLAGELDKGGRLAAGHAVRAHRLLIVVVAPVRVARELHTVTTRQDCGTSAVRGHVEEEGEGLDQFPDDYDEEKGEGEEEHPEHFLDDELHSSSEDQDWGREWPGTVKEEDQGEVFTAVKEEDQSESEVLTVKEEASKREHGVSKLS